MLEHFDQESLQHVRGHGQDFARHVVRWVPWGLLGTYVATIVISASISIYLSGGSPCEVPLCDISVYGGWPKDGPELIVFKTGFTLMAVQCVVSACGRYILTGYWCSAPFFALAVVAMLTMAYIPFYASQTHFFAAGATFAFLAVGQALDTCLDSGAPGWLRCTRVVLIVCTVGFFGTWFYAEVALGMSWPALEYIASALPFVYFLTWGCIADTQAGHSATKLLGAE